MDSKTEKLTIMLDMLTHPNGATTQEIIDRLTISRKTFYRYLDELSEHGFIINDNLDYYGNTNSKRWNINQERYPQSFKIKLSIVQQFLLRFFMEQGSRFKDTNLNEEVDNLKSKVNALTLYNQKRMSTTSYINLKGIKDYRGKEHIIEEMCKAIEGRYRLEITYKSATSKIAKTYDIEPYTLVDHSNALYCLVSVPHHNNTIRTLALERIERIQPKRTETFIVPKEFSPDIYLKDSFGITKEEPIFIRAHFSSSSALYAKERIWGLDQKIITHDDGSVELSFTASGYHEIKNWILSFGSDIKLLEPDSLIQKIKQEIEKMNTIY